MILARVGGGTVSGDTHSAALSGSAPTYQDDGSSIVSAAGGTNAALAAAQGSADIGVVETTLHTATALTPTISFNKIFLSGSVTVKKLTNTGTGTYRLKEGASILFSTTSASLAANAAAIITASGILTNQTVASHTYTSTLEFSTTGGNWGADIINVHEASGNYETSAVVADGSSAVGGRGGGNGLNQALYSADITTTETQTNSNSITLTSAVNVMYLSAFAQVKKTTTGGGTLTMRIKESGATIFSGTSAAITLSDGAVLLVTGSLSNQTAALHTYTVTLQFSNNGGQWVYTPLMVSSFSFSADSHAASLSGSGGSCA